MTRQKHLLTMQQKNKNKNKAVKAERLSPFFCVSKCIYRVRGQYSLKSSAAPAERAPAAASERRGAAAPGPAAAVIIVVLGYGRPCGVRTGKCVFVHRNVYAVVLQISPPVRKRLDVPAPAPHERHADSRRYQ